MINWFLNLLGGSMDLGLNLPITGADDGGGEAGSSSDGGSEGAGDGGGDNSGEGGDGGDSAAGGGSAGGSSGGSVGSGDSFESDLAGKTVEELIALNTKLRDDRSKKNKALEGLKGTKKELDAAKTELARIAREKMNDDEKRDADSRAATERADASDAKVKKYRIKTAANSTGTKVLDPDFVEYKISEHLKANPDATDEDLAGVTTALLKSSPIAFESSNGSGGTVNTAGGGASAQAGRVSMQSELELVNKQLESRAGLTLQQDAELCAKKARLTQQLSAQSGAGT